MDFGEALGAWGWQNLIDVLAALEVIMALEVDDIDVVRFQSFYF